MAAFSFFTSSEAATRVAGRRLGEMAVRGDVIVLAGDLGAGKTVLAKGLALGLGVEGEVTSPTFNLLVVHRGREAFNHFDLYRLEEAADLEDIDFWGVLESQGVSAIEWGDRFPQELPSDRLEVQLSIGADDRRRIDVVSCGTRGDALAKAWEQALTGDTP